MLRTPCTIMLALAAIAPGCSPTMDLPANFVDVDQPHDAYDLRAVSADGVVVALRSEDNPDRGTLDFWAKAIQQELTARPGYTLTANDPVTSASGDDGVLLAFDVKKEATEMKYLLAVFLKFDKVVIAEAAGPADAVNPIRPELRTALLSVR